MRQYNIKTIIGTDDFDDKVIGISTKNTTDIIRTEYYYHSDDGCYWAKSIDGLIYR